MHIAAIQMASGPNMHANLAEAGRLLKMAAQAGMALCVLPENFALMGMHEEDKVAVREKPGQGPLQNFLSQQAEMLGIWLVGGTIPLEASVPHKVRAACLLFNPHGDPVARYDKIHLFDVMLNGAGEEHYNESGTIEPGEQPVVAETPFGPLGLAVCYDLRFPELFRAMQEQGARLFAVPSAFTAATGRVHWETLLRARAIENLAYVVAANQGGYHVNGRETYGDSMIVDPWGVILARHPRNAGVICTAFDQERQSALRENFPALKHRRLMCR